ncbi:8525_t:CDS:1, partial [Ambispora leptoticha]
QQQQPSSTKIAVEFTQQQNVVVDTYVVKLFLPSPVGCRIPQSFLKKNKDN